MLQGCFVHREITIAANGNAVRGDHGAEIKNAYMYDTTLYHTNGTTSMMTTSNTLLADGYHTIMWNNPDVYSVSPPPNQNNTVDDIALHINYDIKPTSTIKCKK